MNWIKKNKTLAILLAIFLIAVVLRTAFVARHDAYTDEVLLGVRSIGLIDYVTATYQRTPWQWVDPLPWWLHLSFHDHPLGYFLAQNLSIKIFGETLLALRIPAIISGLAAIGLAYLIGVRLLDKRFALIAAAIMSVLSYNVWISRIGLQDGMATTFILLVIWLWLKSIEKQKWWLWFLWGLSLGLAFFVKYTTFIIVPILLLHAFIYKINFFKNKLFWLGSAAAILASSPIWIYNYYLYQEFGHFDFQFSALLNQPVAEWVNRVGRNQVGSVGDRFKLFFQALYQSSSHIFNALLSISFVWLLVELFQKKKKEDMFIFGSFILMWLWFFVVGSTYRFVIMIVPFAVFIISYFLHRMMGTFNKKIILIVFSIWLGLEFLFSFNTFINLEPFGNKNIAYAQIREEVEHVGYTELNNYVDNLFDKKVSALFGQPDYRFLADSHNEYIDSANELGFEKKAVIVVYNRQLNFLASLWTFNRHIIYRGWPILNADDFTDITSGRYDEFYREQGIEEFVYVTNTPDNLQVLDPAILTMQDTGESDGRLREYLDNLGIEPRVLHNKLGEPAFHVYEF